MSKTTIVILILIALFIILNIIGKQREPGSGKTQDELLNSMSDDELLDLAGRIRAGGVNIPPFQGKSRGNLINFIKKYQNG